MYGLLDQKKTLKKLDNDTEAKEIVPSISQLNRNENVNTIRSKINKRPLENIKSFSTTTAEQISPTTN